MLTGPYCTATVVDRLTALCTVTVVGVVTALGLATHASLSACDTCVASDLPGTSNAPLPEPAGRRTATLACSTICPRVKFPAARERSFQLPERPRAAASGKQGESARWRRSRSSATIVAEEAGTELARLLTRRPNTRYRGVQATLLRVPTSARAH
jgi:hypothetical protein